MRNFGRIAYYFVTLLRHAHWEKKRLKHYRDQHVRKIVKYAYGHSQFYHEWFKEQKLSVDEVKNVDDLNKLPVVHRKELQENAAKLISDQYAPTGLHVKSTSGSTGQPFFTYLSENEYDLRQVKQLRNHFICGHGPRDRWVLICPPEQSGIVSSLQRMLRVYAPMPVSVFDDTSQQAERIRYLKPDVLDGYSSSLLLIAKHIEKNGITGIKPRMCMCGAELLHSSDRAVVERVLDAPCFDQYGSEEFGRIAWQCRVKKNYHVDFDTLAMQFLDKNAEEVAPGEEGEIVCTSLFNYAMPILRYALGDVGVPCGDDLVCDCGVTFPLLKLIAGRSEEAVVLPDGRVFSPLAIGDSMCGFTYFNDVMQYRFVQKRLDRFNVLVKRRPDGVNERIMGDELVSHLRRQLRLSRAEAEIEVDFVEEIPPDKSGKIRKIVSEL